MRLVRYKDPAATGWQGYIEAGAVGTEHGETVGFVKIDGTIVWAWELGHRHFERKVDGEGKKEVSGSES